MKRLLCLSMLCLATLLATARQSPDFAEKFFQLCQADSSVECVTVSPKMIEQMLQQHAADGDEQLLQAMSKLRSARIVTAPASYMVKAEDLLRKHSSRFCLEREFATSKGHGAFYSRKARKGPGFEELIMLQTDTEADRLTIVCLTGLLDEQFLCFLYNNESFKN